jgi:hypothetical protein
MRQTVLIINTVMTLFCYGRFFLPWQEKRKDLVRIHDRVHDALPLINTSPMINFLAYSSYIHYLYYMYQGQVDIELSCLYLTLLIYHRIAMIYVCPLLAPVRAYPLVDMTHQLVLRGVNTFQNDLFFSGHVACGIMLGLTIHDEPSASNWHYLCTGLQALCMLFSRVHYTIDILVAPYVSYGCFVLARFILNQFRFGAELIYLSGKLDIF